VRSKPASLLVHQQAADAVFNYVGVRAHSGDQDHCRRTHGLDGRQPEAFVTGSGHEQVRSLQQTIDLLAAGSAMKVHAVREAKLHHPSFEPGAQRGKIRSHPLQPQMRIAML